MNDAVLQELKRVVERAVRPVRATMGRKRRMREELLAHLTAIFAEEAERLGDEQAALERAKERFGDPRELTGQLQEAVPRWDRLARLCEFGDSRPNEPLLRYAGRITILTLLLSAASTLLLLPVVFTFGRENESGMRVYCLFCIGIFNIPFTSGFMLLVEGMYRALYRVCRSWRSATAYGLASLSLFPVVAFEWQFSLTGDFAASCSRLWLALCFAPLAPVLFAGLARQTAERLRHDEEWASLEIGE